MGKGVIYYKKKHTLLLKCFITFLVVWTMVGETSDSIHRSLIVAMVFFLLSSTLKCPKQILIWGTFSAREIG